MSDPRYPAWSASHLYPSFGFPSASRSLDVLPGQLEVDNLGPLDLASGVRLPLGTDWTATAGQASKAIDLYQGIGRAEVCKLEAKSAIKPADPRQDQFSSQIFLVPKKDGAQCPVVNLKPLNRWIVKRKFKMEGERAARDLIRKSNWMVSIDLKDAYLSVPIHQDHRKYLRFLWKGTTFEFQCLPFGLSSAPRVFTKLIKPVMALLRKQGIRSLIFLDDMLLMAESKEELEKKTQEVLTILRLLGFRINWEKSQLTPSHRIIYLGLIIDSMQMTFTLPEQKVQRTVAECQSAIRKGRVSVRELSRLIGRMSATVMAVLPAPLCFRGLQAAKNRSLTASQSFETVVTLTREAVLELQWWSQMLRKWNGCKIHPWNPDLIIETDASLFGWGAVSGQVSTGGALVGGGKGASHQCPGIAWGGALAVKTFLKDKGNMHVHLKMDNRTAISYINHMGGTRSHTLSQSACDLWHWCLQKGITLSAEHLPGKENLRADRESRTLLSTAEWMLERSVCLKVMQVLGPCSVDLFASRINNQLDRYVSWRPDPFAIATDTFQQSWQEEAGFPNLP